MKMIIVTLRREKCIGCGYCADVAGEYFSISSADGKSELAGAVEKKGFFTLRTGDGLAYEPCRMAGENCPVHIIEVKRV